MMEEPFFANIGFRQSSESAEVMGTTLNAWARKNVTGKSVAAAQPTV